MTRKQVWRYSCDYCEKKGLSAGHMKAHEASCTANPERVCRMHKRLGAQQRPITELRAALDRSLPDCGMKELRRLADDCPMCILAAIRQSGIAKWDGDPESSPPDLGFNFKAELASMWAMIKDAEAVDEYPRYEVRLWEVGDYRNEEGRR